MRISLLMLLIPICFGKISGQVVSSSCTAHDSIIQKYRDDADRLAMKKFYRNNLPYKDSVLIPEDHADTVLRALIAVYNATSLPARDSVISMYDVHTFPDIYLNEIALYADSSLPWMQQLKNGNIPTGDPDIDSLLAKYGLNLVAYYTAWDSIDFAWFRTDSNYNIPAMGNLFLAIPGVFSAEPNGLVGEGNNITDSIYTDHVELIYSYGWGDCWAGCIFHRYWKFNVDTNCNVEYAGSYGDLVTSATTLNDLAIETVRIFPNPFTKNIFITGIQSSFRFSLYDIAGRELFQGTSPINEDKNFENLPSGCYFLTIDAAQKKSTVKIFKE